MNIINLVFFYMKEIDFQCLFYYNFHLTLVIVGNRAQLIKLGHVIVKV